MWRWKKKEASKSKKAIAYYRHSAQDRQENSISIQREQVRKFAEEHDIEIIREFEDHGKSGLSTKGRDSFNGMLSFVRESEEDFEYIFDLDVSRFGRFQDPDEAASYEWMCKLYGKRVIHTKGGFKDDDPYHSLYLNIERVKAREYSRELSDKVFKGCVKIVEQGFRAGGLPPYGLNRLLLDEQRNPVQILEPGQRKSIQNQRVTLAPGDPKEIAVVRSIFDAFVKRRLPVKEIAVELNAQEIPSPRGQCWTNSSVHSVLTNELYIGTMIYNKTSQKLQSLCTQNPKEDWIRTENAFEGIVGKELFKKAQAIFTAREAEYLRKYSAEDMLLRLSKLREKYGIINSNLIAANKDMVSPRTYRSRFSSLDLAYQNLFKKVLNWTKLSVAECLKQMTNKIEEYENYYVLNDSFSIHIQPSVPIPFGYKAYWPFRPDPRIEVDITLGVPLSNNGKHEILGYLVFPRMLITNRNIRLFSSNDSILDLYGQKDLGMIKDLLE